MCCQVLHPGSIDKTEAPKILPGAPVNNAADGGGCIQCAQTESPSHGAARILKFGHLNYWTS